MPNVFYLNLINIISYLMDRLVFSSFLRHHLSASRFLHSSRGLIGRSRYFSSDTAEKLGLFGAKVTGSLEVAVVPALQDNYMYLVKHLSSGNMLCVDPADANAVELALQTLSWPIHKLRFILNTHHHMDHVGGNIELQAKAKNAIIVGSSKGASRIPV